MICKWYNNDIIELQKNIPFPEKFRKSKIKSKLNINYKNVLDDVQFNTSKHLFNLPIIDDNNDTLERTYKYKINFSKEQHNILKLYFNECNTIYNLCVDIFKDYDKMTDNWMILKDVIYDIYYRDKNTIKNSKKLIIEKLKLIDKEYDLENEKNKEKIEKLKTIEKEKFKIEKEKYKQIMINNVKNTIIDKIKKPRLKKIKIEKIKKPIKPRRTNIKKPAPDETLKGEIKTFCSNLKSAKTNSFNNNNSPFELKYKNIIEKQTIIVSDRNITSKGIFSNALKELECINFKKIMKKYKIDKECKLMFDNRFNCYYLYVVTEKDKINIKNRKEVVAIDEGEKIFGSYYSTNEIGNLGKNMRVFILKTQQKIKNYQKILKKNKNKKNNKSIKNKKTVRKKILNCFKKIKGYVNEIHKKSANYLCKNYKNILLPTFETKPMISKNKIKLETERIKKIEGKDKAKVELKILCKTIKLSKNVKFVLSMQSHYRFKEYLKALAKRYKTVVYDVDESFTSQMCTKCGLLSKKYNNERIKQCTCGYKIDRDVNGSRNILLKCIGELTSKLGMTT